MPVPGCVNGKLEDHRTYFFSLVKNEPFIDDENAVRVLSKIEEDLNKYWIAIQHSSDGEIRPRLHIPVQGRLPVPSDTVWHDVDLVNADHTDWEYIDRGGPYTPAPCDGVTPPPPTNDLEERVAALETEVTLLAMKLEALTKGTVQFNESVVLETDHGWFVIERLIPIRQNSVS